MTTNPRSFRNYWEAREAAAGVIAEADLRVADRILLNGHRRAGGYAIEAVRLAACGWAAAALAVLEAATVAHRVEGPVG